MELSRAIQKELSRGSSLSTPANMNCFTRLSSSTPAQMMVHGNKAVCFSLVRSFHSYHGSRNRRDLKLYDAEIQVNTGKMVDPSLPKFALARNWALLVLSIGRRIRNFIFEQVNNAIIHSLRIHHCKAQPAGPILGPDAKTVHLVPVDGDAVRMLSSSKIWIDHNTLYDCPDGLIDVTRDVFESGASFSPSRSDGGVAVKPNYTKEHIFPIEYATKVWDLTKSAGALKMCKSIHILN
ncbi:hypothetical protein ACH5RR_007989 [Cinchona calisaya]|uniref:Pectate lyase n=1 Tax=Cinchona calisaya TaxID=153742 RepID=A0ABD3AD07_9GENT